MAEKKHDARTKLLLCLSKPIAFLLSSLRKLPIGGFVTGLSSTEAPLRCSEAGEKKKKEHAEHDTDNYFYYSFKIFPRF